MQLLKAEFERKQFEVQEHMTALKQKNELLEIELKAKKEEDDPAAMEVAGAFDASFSPMMDRAAASPLPLDESPGTPPTNSPSRSSRLSMISLSPNASPASGNRGGRQRRQSIAAEALSAPLPGNSQAEAMPRHSIAGGGGEIRSQRAWWKQQRSFLLQDLNPHGTPWPSMSPSNGIGGRTPAGRRQSTVGTIGHSRPEISPSSEPLVEDLDARHTRSQTSCNLESHFVSMEAEQQAPGAPPPAERISGIPGRPAGPVPAGFSASPPAKDAPAPTKLKQPAYSCKMLRSSTGGQH